MQLDWFQENKTCKEIEKESIILKNEKIITQELKVDKSQENNYKLVNFITRVYKIVSNRIENTSPIISSQRSSINNNLLKLKKLLNLQQIDLIAYKESILKHD